MLKYLRRKIKTASDKLVFYSSTNTDSAWSMPLFYVFLGGGNDKLKNKDVTGENLSVKQLTWRICEGKTGAWCVEGGAYPL